VEVPNKYREGTVVVIVRMPKDLKQSAQRKVRQWRSKMPGLSLNRLLCILLEDVVRSRSREQAMNMDPAALIPTQGAMDTAGSGLEELIEDIRANGVAEPVSLIECGGSYYIFDGHRRVAAALVLGLSSVPAIVEFREHDGMPWKQPVREFIASVSSSFRDDFEDLFRKRRDKS
jgi:hypothetical protein